MKHLLLKLPLPLALLVLIFPRVYATEWHVSVNGHGFTYCSSIGFSYSVTAYGTAFSTPPLSISSCNEGSTENMNRAAIYTSTGPAITWYPSGDYNTSTGKWDVGDGTLAHPWSLEFALSNPPDPNAVTSANYHNIQDKVSGAYSITRWIKPGDIIWVHAGTYTGYYEKNVIGYYAPDACGYASGMGPRTYFHFTLPKSYDCFLRGSSTQPVVVRPWPGDHVVLDLKDKEKKVNSMFQTLANTMALHPRVKTKTTLCPPWNPCSISLGSFTSPSFSNCYSIETPRDFWGAAFNNLENLDEINVYDNYVWIWGLEMTNSTQNRFYDDFNDNDVGTGVNAVFESNYGIYFSATTNPTTTNNRAISLIIHDLNGIGIEQNEATSYLTYEGNLGYNIGHVCWNNFNYNGKTGVKARTINHGTGVYAQGQYHRISNNIFFDNLNPSFTVHGSNAPINYISVDSNIAFNGAAMYMQYDKDGYPKTPDYWTAGFNFNFYNSKGFGTNDNLLANHFFNSEYDLATYAKPYVVGGGYNILPSEYFFWTQNVNLDFDPMGYFDIKNNYFIGGNTVLVYRFNPFTIFSGNLLALTTTKGKVKRFQDAAECLEYDDNNYYPALTYNYSGISANSKLLPNLIYCDSNQYYVYDPLSICGTNINNEHAFIRYYIHNPALSGSYSFFVDDSTTSCHATRCSTCTSTSQNVWIPHTDWISNFHINSIPSHHPDAHSTFNRGSNPAEYKIAMPQTTDRGRMELVIYNPSKSTTVNGVDLGSCPGGIPLGRTYTIYNAQDFYNVSGHSPVITGTYTGVISGFNMGGALAPNLTSSTDWCGAISQPNGTTVTSSNLPSPANAFKNHLVNIASTYPTYGTFIVYYFPYTLTLTEDPYNSCQIDLAITDPWNGKIIDPTSNTTPIWCTDIEELNCDQTTSTVVGTFFTHNTTFSISGPGMYRVKVMDANNMTAYTNWFEVKDCGAATNTYQFATSITSPSIPSFSDRAINKTILLQNGDHAITGYATDNSGLSYTFLQEVNGSGHPSPLILTQLYKYCSGPACTNIKGISLAQDPIDQGIVIVGNFGASDGFAMKINISGTPQWFRVLTAFKPKALAYDLKPTSSNPIAILGNYANGANIDLGLITLNRVTGSLLNQPLLYGTSANDAAIDIKYVASPSSTGPVSGTESYILLGATPSTGSPSSLLLFRQPENLSSSPNYQIKYTAGGGGTYDVRPYALAFNWLNASSGEFYGVSGNIQAYPPGPSDYKMPFLSFFDIIGSPQPYSWKFNFPPATPPLTSSDVYGFDASLSCYSSIFMTAEQGDPAIATVPYDITLDNITPTTFSAYKLSPSFYTPSDRYSLPHCALTGHEEFFAAGNKRNGGIFDFEEYYVNTMRDGSINHGCGSLIAITQSSLTWVTNTLSSPINNANFLPTNSDTKVNLSMINVNASSTNVNCAEGGETSPPLSSPFNVNNGKDSANEDKSVQFSQSYIHAYPNPTKDVINIDYQLPDLTPSSIGMLQIFNSLGQLEQQFELAQSKAKIPVDVRTWASGMYIYKVVTQGKLIFTGNFFIQK